MYAGLTCLQKDFCINFDIYDVIQYIINQLIDENELYANYYSGNKEDVVKDALLFFKKKSYQKDIADMCIAATS